MPTARTSQEVSTTPDLVTGIYTAELADQYQRHPDVQAMLDSLTPEDIATSVGADGTGAEAHTELEKQEAAAVIARTMNVLEKYQDVNNYIAQQKFPNPSISKDSRFDMLPKNDYKYNRPTGVVVHETANDYSSISTEVNFMYDNYNNAFVHAYVDNGKVIETAPTEYKAWGAGGQANPFYIHIELVRESSFHNFAKSVSNDAYWIASQLYQWGLTPSLADNNGGKGSVISHNAVSKYLGGTTHVDPVTYFAKWGYNMNQFYALIVSKYNAIKASDNRTATIKSKTAFNHELLVADNSYRLYTNPYNTPGATPLKSLQAIAKNEDPIQVKEAIVTSEGVKIYGLANGLYVDQRALKAKATVVEEKAVDKIMSVTNTGYYLYDLPYNTLGASRQKQMSEVYQNLQQVKVVAETLTSQNIKLYKLENGYYVDRRALSELATIKTQTDFSPANNMKVVNNGYYIYSKPYNTLGMKRVSLLKDKLAINANAEITSEVVTSTGVKTYHINNLGWVDYRAFENYKTFDEDTSFKAIGMRVVDDGYYIYSNPYGNYNANRVTQLKEKFKNGNKVQITRYGITSSGVKTYYIENVGWVDHRALGSLATFNDDVSFSAKTMRIKNNGYNIYSAPYNNENSAVVSPISSKYAVNAQVRVTRYGTTSEGIKTYYIENVGWVDYRAVKEVATFTDDASFSAKTMRIKNNGYNIYSAPYNNENSTVVSPISSKYAVNAQVRATHYGTTSEGIKTYYIENVGWIDYRAVKEVATFTDDSSFKAKNMKIKNIGYNIYSAPFNNADATVIKSISSKYKVNDTVRTTRYGKTSEGIKTYYIENVGWVDYRAVY
ncbi:hypothetical protein FA707_08685 [Vagococcus zengguangii]|uniref:N-acetylmuramoyl-L-alanine amidase domain-containing protein n=2 Tax=Vagococcus zengguangii TaxID=2571750 RepID=A0A4D7CY14_9ENTE|nr:hypothetical protein FA707_08685 [Vagococcus zengguangii]